MKYRFEHQKAFFQKGVRWGIGEAQRKKILVEVMLTESILCRLSSLIANERGQKVEGGIAIERSLYHDAVFRLFSPLDNCEARLLN